MSTTPDLDLILRRLAETIAWCRLHVSESDPRQSLRTPALRLVNLALEADQWGIFDYEWLTNDDERARVDAVNALAETRADLLRREDGLGDVAPGLPLDLAGGRLLIAMPHESDVCGLSEAETFGFIDDMDVPAWDTWVCWLREPSKTVPEGYSRPYIASYLLCWIPPQFVSLVEAGTLVNPTECFFWAVEYKRRNRHVNTALLRQLDAAGLLT